MTRSFNVDQDSPVHVPKQLIAKARDASKVDIAQVHAFLEGSPAKAEEMKRVTSEIANDPVLASGTEYYELTKAQQRELTVKKIARLALYLEQDLKRVKKDYHRDVVEAAQAADAPLLRYEEVQLFEQRCSLMAVVDPQVGTRLGVNLSLFGNCVRGNGTDAQIRYWLQERGLVFGRGIYGCFAMTELGHGSNVAALQTLAVYDAATDTFRIHTPDLVATKWWIGGAAHSATHSTVYARLVVEGKDYGVKTFVVPLRDPATMELVAGVSIGDIGAKMGRDGIDNGWIQFNNVVIPREYMLSRFTKVVPGTPPRVEMEPLLDTVSGYSALLSGRVNMVLDSFRFGAKFTTIACRYAVGRQQFGERGSESQLISYPLHQYRVIPQLAIAYLLAPASQRLFNTYERVLTGLYAAGDDKDKLMELSEQLKDLFIESASLKATGTWLVANLIDELRQACGGHGYSAYNGFGKGYNDWVVQCTWEGDNNVLCLTSGKSILKKFADIARGKKVVNHDASLSYVTASYMQKIVMGGIGSVGSLKQLTDFTDIWSATLVRYLKKCAETVRKTKDVDGVSKPLVSIAKFHAYYSMLKEFHRKLSSDDDSFVTDEATKETLWKLYKLFSLYFIDKHSGEILQLKVLTPDQLSNNVQNQLSTLLADLKDEVIRLTDAFHLPDPFLNAPIGFYDGDIYHNYFNEVTKNAAVDERPGAPPYAERLTSMLGRGQEFERLGNVTADLFKKLSG